MEDAGKFGVWLKDRFGKFHLELPEEKTHTMTFGRFARERAKKYGKIVETFDFLGFTHVCGKDRKGKFALIRLPGKKSCRKFLDRGKEWLHSILKDGSLGLSKGSERRLKDKVREITKRKRGISMEEMLRELRTKLQGWLNYFRYAGMSSKMEAIDGWIRRKLKCFRLKQCKRTIGIVRWLRKLGVEKTLSWRTALSGKGWWRLSNSPALGIGMNQMWLAQQGYYILSENYKALHHKSL